MRAWLVWVLWWGCAAPAPHLERSLERAGPVRVTVDELGQVPLPEVRWSDGAPADQVRWQVVGGEAVAIEAGELIARKPGRAELRGELDGQEVAFTVVVQPAVQLEVVPPPAQLSVGQTLTLQVSPMVQGTAVPGVALDWRSSNELLAVVDASGLVEGRAPGLVYVTVDAGRSQAMIELEIVP